MAMILSAAFLFITVCAGTAAFLRKDESDQPVINNDPQQEAPIDENTAPGEENLGENGEEEPPAEEMPIVFNKPDSMRGVVVNAGTDFLTDLSKSDEEQQAEINKMLDKVESYEMNTVLVTLLSPEGSVFSISSIQSLSSFDALEYLIEAARERGLFVYGIYDLSLYADGAGISRMELKNT